ncbi:MAG: DDE-type integrase/transposase/recombinase, partial [Sphingomonadales bacterium]|nr:DDE-type integrase/transposase/recombinase [Sphingomonadales bacterium]
MYDNLISIAAVKETYKRPMTECVFKDSKTRALYDTGSCVTCMSENVYDKLSAVDRKNGLVKSNRTFLSASGTKMSACGQIELPMNVEGRTVTHKVHVLPKLHEPLILGIDFIQEHGLRYCPTHCQFHWSEQCPVDHASVLTLRQKLVLPPLSTKVCTVRVDGNRPAGACGIASVLVEDQPWIRGGPVWTKMQTNGVALVELRNASPVPRELPRGLKLGMFEPLEEDEAKALAVEDLIKGEVTEDLRQKQIDAMKDSKKNDCFISPKDKSFIDTHLKLGCSDQLKASYRRLMYENQRVFSKHKNDLGRCDLIQHEIHLKDKNPVYIKQFKIPEVHQTSIEEQVREWLKLGIIQPSKSRYNSPIFVVKKKDGNFRLVQDFRALNAKTYPDRYSMRDVNDCIYEIGKSDSSIFSTIDLTSGFWQMVLKPECREYTAFTVYGMGQYEFRTSPMGLLGCPASFQRLMEAAMKGIPGVLVYIDDILIHSKTHEQHQETLRRVFQRLARHNLKIRLEKCHFATTEVEYLGFRLTPKGVLPGTDKTAVIRNAPPPDTVQKVRQFLGLCNFFRNHIRDFALKSHPLSVLTRKDIDWKGGTLPPEALTAFQELKTALTSSPVVSFPRRELQYALITDAATGDSLTPGGMGAILTQVDKEGRFHVIAYASRKLVKHEKNYMPFLLEMHAAVWGMEHFAHHLKGRRFLLFTDHKPLEKLGTVHTRTLYRIQEAMMDFDFEIHYKKGEEMPADYLSRNIASLTDNLSHDKISRLQNEDPHLSKLIKYLQTGVIPQSSEDKQLITRYGARCFLDKNVLWIRHVRPEVGNRSLICLPASLRQEAISLMHTSWYGGHAGTLKTTERLLLYFYWPNMHHDVQLALKDCEKCQKRNTNPKVPTAYLQPLPLLSEPNQRIHADLFGPLKTSPNGKKFILVMTDAFTRYVELVAIDNKETETVANAIFVFWICRYGVPLELVTDQGKEFVSKVCQSLWEKLDLIHNTTSPRHPQANAQAEVVNRTIIRYLGSFVDESTLDWECFLAPLMFSYNTTYHRSLKTSPFFLTFGLHPRLPQELDRPYYGTDLPTELMQRLQVARNIARQFMDKAALDYKRQHDDHAVQRTFRVNQEVLLDEHSFLNKNQKLCEKYSGPHLVTKLIGPVNLELLLQNGRKALVHVNRVKPFNCGLDTPGNVSQNGGGDGVNLNLSANDKDFPQNSNDLEVKTTFPDVDFETRRLTRSQTKRFGLSLNPETKTFGNSSMPNIEAIRRKKVPKVQTQKIRQRSSTSKVRPGYIEFDFDEDEWDPTPDWSRPRIDDENDDDDDDDGGDEDDGDEYDCSDGCN